MLAPVETRYARSAMVSSADHVATGAGVAMLRAGGSAADAAIAANAVLAVTWPQHCGRGAAAGGGRRGGRPPRVRTPGRRRPPPGPGPRPRRDRARRAQRLLRGT